MNEGLGSSAELLLPERSYIGRTYGDRREQGAMLNYNVKPLQIRLMASNGQLSAGGKTTNLDDNNNSKDINGRVDYEINDEFKIGIFSGSSTWVVGTGQRSGANVSFAKERLLVRVEGVQARELDIDKNGINAEAAYQLSDLYQVAARYDNHQQTTAPESSANAYTLGVNYFLSAHNSKIQMAYTAMNNFEGNKGSYQPAANKNGGLVILNFQAAL
jgi:hypothetical protein